MTDMPETIFAWPSAVTPPDETALAGSWGVKRFPEEAVGYVSKAFHDAAIAAEREACAKVAVELAEQHADMALNGDPNAARYRESAEAMATKIAAAIRARKDTE